ncbi:ATP-grasp domain-containing protein [Cohnella faecalis]|uniref:ATP-grasp domain-containing protein n=2 Tax=Cohnella faecalis TaxID=2315694 RepID=A0A398CFI7_9BACL|nr:ATP-grasp domain-containing protein [Cohnella faecalis]
MNPYQVQNAQNKQIMKKAREMGIECEPLIPGCEDFLELSYRGKTIVINKTRSHKMPLMAGLLAKNKDASNLLLRRRGLPVPDYIVVSQAGEEAVRFLNTHRMVIVKPLDTSRSVGVTLRIDREDDLENAVKTARLHSEQVMIQQYVEGTDFRVLVIGGKAIGALEYKPAFIEGDGRSTIEQLIRKLNEDQLRRNSVGDAGSFQPVDVESKSLLMHLQELGKSLQAVLEQGERVELFSGGNILADGISEIVLDRSEDISAVNANIAVEAAKALQVDVAGIDIRCRDIRLPLNDENGGILEVNALPDMIDPSLFFQGASTDVFQSYLQYLFEE